MRVSLSGIQTRVNRLAERVERCGANSADSEEMMARLDEGRRRAASGPVEPPWTEEQFTTWAEDLRKRVRGSPDAAFAERLIAGRQRALQVQARSNETAAERAPGPLPDHAQGKPCDTCGPKDALTHALIGGVNRHA